MDFKQKLKAVEDIYLLSDDDLTKNFIDILDNTSSDDLYYFMRIIKKIKPDYIIPDEVLEKILFDKDSILYKTKKTVYYLSEYINDYIELNDEDRLEELVKSIYPSLDAFKTIFKSLNIENYSLKLLNVMYKQIDNPQFMQDIAKYIKGDFSFVIKSELIKPDYRMNSVYMKIFEQQTIDNIDRNFLKSYIDIFMETNNLIMLEDFINSYPNLFNIGLKYIIHKDHPIINDLDRYIGNIVELFDNSKYIIRDIIISKKLNIDIDRDTIDELMKNISKPSDKEIYHGLKSLKNYNQNSSIEDIENIEKYLLYNVDILIDSSNIDLNKNFIK